MLTLPLLLAGEPGTGKATLARAIHVNGPRRDFPYLALDCRTLGHTAAEEPAHVVRWEAALQRSRGGSVFLQAIDALPAILQARLARLLTEQRLTGNCPIRFLASSTVDLAAAAASNRFRQNLFYSLIPLSVPPLRNRLLDLPVLIHLVLHRLGAPQVTLTPEVWQALRAHRWPGNLRELATVLERAVLLRDTDTLTLTDFPDLQPAQLVASSTAVERVR
jgi:DNA-binding NtrC family response regulator